jgi:hypothetical protein
MGGRALPADLRFADISSKWIASGLATIPPKCPPSGNQTSAADDATLADDFVYSGSDAIAEHCGSLGFGTYSADYRNAGIRERFFRTRCRRAHEHGREFHRANEK